MNTETMWQIKIRQINEAGVTFRQIAEKAECSLGGISDLASGRTQDATYARGLRILALHKQVTKRSRR